MLKANRTEYYSGTQSQAQLYLTVSGNVDLKKERVSRKALDFDNLTSWPGIWRP